MKIRASDVVDPKKYRYKVVDHIDSGYIDRVYRISAIKDNAVEFAHDILADIELPTVPELQVGNIRGFEKVKPIDEIIGYIVVNAKLTSLSGRGLHIALPIPIYRGEFLRPSILIVNNKRVVFSKDNVEYLLSRFESTRPVTTEVFMPNQEILHEEIIERPIFSGPAHSIEWGEVNSLVEI